MNDCKRCGNICILDALDISSLDFPNGGDVLQEAMRVQESFWEHRGKAHARLLELVSILEEREERVRTNDG